MRWFRGEFISCGLVIDLGTFGGLLGGIFAVWRSSGGIFCGLAIDLGTFGALLGGHFCGFGDRVGAGEGCIVVIWWSLRWFRGEFISNGLVIDLGTFGSLLGGYFKYNGASNISSIGSLDTTEKPVISFPRDGSTLSLLTGSSTALQIDSARSIQFNEYSGTNKTGTPTYILGTTSTGTIVKVLGGDIPGQTGGPFLPLAGGIMTGVTTFNDHTLYGDQVKAKWGVGGDLEIYHDGSHSYIDDAGTGNLYIRSNSIILGKYTGETMVQGNADGAVDLYYDSSKKLAT